MNYNITALFFCLDEFSKSYEGWEKHRLIDTGKKRYRSCEMTLNEMLTIMVFFHLNPCKNFKYFYCFPICHFAQRVLRDDKESRLNFPLSKECKLFFLLPGV